MHIFYELLFKYMFKKKKKVHFFPHLVIVFTSDCAALWGDVPM